MIRPMVISGLTKVIQAKVTLLRAIPFLVDLHFFLYAEVNAVRPAALPCAPFAGLFSSKGVSYSSQFSAIKRFALKLSHCDLLPRSVVNHSFYLQENLCRSASEARFCDILRQIFSIKLQLEREIYD